jgi:hypothetical protein
VPDGQASARQPVVGFWPVIGFRDRAQYEAERGTVVTVPDTPVSIDAVVVNGEWGGAGEFRTASFDAVVSGRVGTEAGQNAVDWRFLGSTKQVGFGDTLVSVGLEPVLMPDDLPAIMFDDFSPSIGGSTQYYPTLLEETVEVSRPAADPGSGGVAGEGPSESPEPSSAGLLLTGFALAGLAALRRSSPLSGMPTGQSA